MTQAKKYKITFSRAIDSISGTVMSEESIVEVKLPKSLSHASSDAFSGCTSLEKVTIADSFNKKSGENYIDAVVNGDAVRFEGL